MRDGFTPSDAGGTWPAAVRRFAMVVLVISLAFACMLGAAGCSSGLPWAGKQDSQDEQLGQGEDEQLGQGADEQLTKSDEQQAAEGDAAQPSKEDSEQLTKEESDKAPEAEAPPAKDGPSLGDLEIHVKTSVLEYSKKETDPVSLLGLPEVEGLEVTTEDRLDLMRVGSQTVIYLAKLGNEEAQFEVAYTIRDTKSPLIELVKDEVTVQEGEAFDPASNVKSVTDSVDGALALVDKAPDKLADNERGLTYDAGWYTLAGDLDTDAPSRYFLTVTATDNHGNEATKKFTVVVEAAPAPVVEEETPEEPAPQPEPRKTTYVINRNTGKFHYPGCPSVKQMNESNKWVYEGTYEEVVDMGYVPCKKCNPH